MSETAKAVVRRNTEEVQGGGDYALYDKLFADDFVDHTPQPSRTPDKAGALRCAWSTAGSPSTGAWPTCSP
ncbi:hypothetical protein ACFVYG_43140 [Streptomyces sp. NPDC058256]|uniref:hypothetical protein n=1 Tax=Streptomyces sp. NPDC058256 TaxID=3346408 RepID=UPI0036EA4DE9